MPTRDSLLSYHPHPARRTGDLVTWAARRMRNLVPALRTYTAATRAGPTTCAASHATSCATSSTPPRTSSTPARKRALTARTGSVSSGHRNLPPTYRESPPPATASSATETPAQTATVAKPQAPTTPGITKPGNHVASGRSSVSTRKAVGICRRRNRPRRRGQAAHRNSAVAHTSPAHGTLPHWTRTIKSGHFHTSWLKLKPLRGHFSAVSVPISANRFLTAVSCCSR